MKKKIYLISFSILIILLVIGVFLYRIYFPDTLAQIRARGKLIVLTRNAPTTYYFGPQGATGFEYDLISDFARHLGVDLEIHVKDTISEILRAMTRGEGDIAAAALTITEERSLNHLFGPPYYTVQQQIVCRRGSKIPKKLEDLVDYRIMIIADSSYEERMRKLKQEIPALKWESTAELSTEQILERVLT
ncbi:transporter substrate-binding domain-containing protein, partial [candidate division CSSED10-310 bacterium]